METGPGNPAGNAFTVRATPIAESADGGRLADPLAGRRWRVHQSRLPEPDGQARRVHPHTGPPHPVLLAQPDSDVAKRVVYGTKHLWVTRGWPDRRYPAGDYPNPPVPPRGTNAHHPV
ncbi:copper amine oxidase [Streptomyces sp. 8N616]|uniref:copper amine oxidase n=1 Tax=Streptomyces sp. 8N616 TaxID=3457414 RepID=UPI003FD552EB